jgi:hypothetical protein
MSTMLAKLEHPDDNKPPSWRAKCQNNFTTSTGTATRAAPLWFFVGEGLSL